MYSLIILLFIFWTRVSLTLVLTDSPCLFGQRYPRSTFSVLESGTHLCTQLFYMDAGDWIWGFMFQNLFTSSDTKECIPYRTVRTVNIILCNSPISCIMGSDRPQQVRCGGHARGFHCRHKASSLRSPQSCTAQWWRRLVSVGYLPSSFLSGCCINDSDQPTQDITFTRHSSGFETHCSP